MEIGAALEFLRSHPRAVLATRRRDGTPQMSPVLVAVDDDGRLLVSTRETAMKTRNIRRDPRVWLVGLNEGFFGRWVQVAGEADVMSLPAAMDLLVEYYRRAAGEHPDWDEYRAAMAAEQRCVLVVRPTSAGPDVAG